MQTQANEKPHLIYNSPAALSFNSPGALGFGVKRASLAIPGSVLLLVSPPCCGRNTSGIGESEEYRNRFFFLDMDETDLVTGRHLSRIPDAVCQVRDDVYARTGSNPSVVMICATCADALLGTDLDRVCRKAEEAAGIPVRPSFMYALMRDGSKPPMVHVRESIYSMLPPQKKNARSINLLGCFAPLSDDCELYDFFRMAGVKTIREISRCADYDEFLRMGEANFNVVLNPEALPAAAELQKRLKIPYLELKRLYRPAKIITQYRALCAALRFEEKLTERLMDKVAAPAEAKAKASANAFRSALSAHSHASASVFSVGEFMNGNAFELSLMLLEEGFSVAEIFAAETEDSAFYLTKIRTLSPETKLYSNLDPLMVHYGEKGAVSVDFTIGRDAAFYHPEARHVLWAEDVQPFGFAGLKHLFEALLSALGSDQTAAYNRQSLLKEALVLFQEKIPGKAQDACKPEDSFPNANECQGISFTAEKTDAFADCLHYKSLSHSGAEQKAQKRTSIRGLRRFLSPFAPDQSGASAVLYSLGGIVVICDAGGCAGNVCGFDEPRWLTEKSRIFSAGLRDMDAILGRDNRLVEKLWLAAEGEDVSFAAVIGTPVPSLIGTDWHALKRMIQKRTGLPALCIDTSGTKWYDTGAQKAYAALFSSFAKKPAKDDIPSLTGFAGILGATPLDTGLADPAAFFSAALSNETVVAYGAADSLEAIRWAAHSSHTLVVSPSGLAAAKQLWEHFGVPYEIAYPGAEGLLNDCTQARQVSFSGKRILVIHQQVLAEEIKRLLIKKGASKVMTASWFMTFPEIGETVSLREENFLPKLIREFIPDIVIGDACMRPLIAEETAQHPLFLDFPHFAVSGRLFS